MKKIINTPETVVYDMCHGLAKAHPELEFVEKYKIVKKKEIDPDKVSLISGGGSGHEPAHAGFVGKGMLDCAVCGDVFASPSQIQHAFADETGVRGLVGKGDRKGRPAHHQELLRRLHELQQRRRPRQG